LVFFGNYVKRKTDSIRKFKSETTTNNSKKDEEYPDYDVL